MKIVEVAWLFVTAVSIFEIVNQWNQNREHAYFFIFTAVVGVFMYLFRRKNRIAHQQRQDKLDQ